MFDKISICIVYDNMASWGGTYGHRRTITCKTCQQSEAERLKQLKLLMEKSNRYCTCGKYFHSEKCKLFPRRHGERPYLFCDVMSKAESEWLQRVSKSKRNARWGTISMTALRRSHIGHRREVDLCQALDRNLDEFAFLFLVVRATRKPFPKWLAMWRTVSCFYCLVSTQGVFNRRRHCWLRSIAITCRGSSTWHAQRKFSECNILFRPCKTFA